jgi:hydrogenase large subunit
MSEASRGALGHWIKTDGRGRIKLYQCVVPTTWNGSPRDANDNPGPAEKGLQGANADALPQDPSPAGKGVWIKDPTQPIEIIRTTHSYDYCIACAVHLITPDGEVHKVVVPPLP